MSQGGKPHVVIAGAGALGCFVGGLLASGGLRVSMLVRARTEAEIRGHGLTLTDFSGMATPVSLGAVGVAEKPEVLGRGDVILVCVRSHDTAKIAGLIDTYAKSDASIVSLQNGSNNMEVLRKLLPGRDVRGAMIPFHVVPMGQGVFHRVSSGDIVIETGKGVLAEKLSVPHLQFAETRDIASVKWGKILINLNNALNALSGLPVQQQLQDRQWRRLMADQWQEALRVLNRAGIAPATTTRVPVARVPAVLRLPGFMFRHLAASMLTIDPQARTPMAMDLMALRPTEIEDFQGVVVQMGTELGLATPINSLIFELIKTAEFAGEGLPDLPAAAITAELAQK